MSRIIVFIENQSYLNFTKPYLDSLIRMNIEFQIFSLENIKIDDIENEKIKFFNSKKTLNKALINLECDYFITTTPGIGNSFFPKSKILPKSKRPKYIYFFHSLVSPNENYAKNSFNGFDIILSPNNTITNQLKYIVGEKYTKILTVGYQHLEKNNKEHINTNNFLIAPSWGKDNLFSDKYNQQLLQMIERLKDNEKNVFLRPHPMDIEILKKLEKINGINLYSTNDINFRNFDCLITDWSGISLEFFYSTRNVVGFVNTPKKIKRKLKRVERKLNLVENMVRNKIGPILDVENLDLELLFNFQYQKSEYIEKLFLPEFPKIDIDNIFLSLFK